MCVNIWGYNFFLYDILLGILLVSMILVILEVSS